MPTPDDLRELSDEPLDDLERELVREALNIDGRAGEAIYESSELRMLALTPVQNILMRKYLYVDLPSVDEDRDVKVLGGNDGKQYNPGDRDNWVQRAMRRLLYPDNNNDPLLTNNGPKSLISSVPIVYATGSTEFD